MFLPAIACCATGNFQSLSRGKTHSPNANQISRYEGHRDPLDEVPSMCLCLFPSTVKAPPDLTKQ